MKRNRMMTALVIFLLAFSLTSCASGVPEEQYNQVCAERDMLRAELQELQSRVPEEKRETVQVSISGHFTAMVRKRIPNYTLDSITPRAVVITFFQNGPTILSVGELADELEEGEVYVFEIEPKSAEIPVEEYEEGIPSPEEAIRRYGLQISDIRVTGEDDYGLEYNHLVIEL